MKNADHIFRLITITTLISTGSSSVKWMRYILYAMFTFILVGLTFNVRIFNEKNNTLKPVLNSIIMLRFYFQFV